MYNPNLSFHFIGIGGAGMSGIAEILLNLGFSVSGSDLRAGPACARLAALGASVAEGHAAENVPPSCSLAVYSSAVAADNPEIIEARSRGIPVVRRAEVLAELMRLKYGVAVAGSHGKTTTTSMIASILEEGRLDPTVVIGGQVKSLASGGKLGRGSFLVAEADESDRSFLLLKPTIAVVTNIDEEHLSEYGSLGDLEAAFEQFALSIPFYGLAVLCADDARVAELARRFRGRRVTYGIAPDADVRAEDLRCSRGATCFRLLVRGKDEGEVTLAMPGRHLALNALAAIAVGLETAVPVDRIKHALASFAGVKRRLEIVGAANGVTVVSDYGHHPTELSATIRAVREGWGSALHRLHVIFQPHRYSRTRDCFAQFLGCFDGADTLTVTDIYAAGEAPIEGISGERLCEAITHPSRTFCARLEDAGASVARLIERDDVVLCLGAGSIGAFAEALPAELAGSAERAA